MVSELDGQAFVQEGCGTLIGEGEYCDGTSSPWDQCLDLNNTWVRMHVNSETVGRITLLT